MAEFSAKFLIRAHRKLVRNYCWVILWVAVPAILLPSREVQQLRIAQSMRNGGYSVIYKPWA